jgi:hypothetical protein
MPPLKALTAALACVAGITAACGTTTITLGQNATDGERYAAAQLRSLLQLPPPQPPPPLWPKNKKKKISNSLGLSGQRILAVGSEASLALLPGLAPELLGELGEEGFLLRTSPDNLSIAITGGVRAPRGCMYGVFRFLELIGFDFLSFNVTNVPSCVTQGKGLFWSGAIDHREIPVLEWRHNNNANLELQAHINFSIALGNNNDGGVQQYTSKDVRKPGGGVRWAPPDFTESSFTLVPPKLYFVSHPEWFAGNCTAGDKGCNGGAGNQLCWGNQSLLAFIAQRVISYLRNSTDANIIAIDQNDERGGSPRPCMRPSDLAIYREEGSWSGPLLRGVNYVADAVSKAFPQRRIRVSTLAYVHTQDPPQKTVPKPNVVVRLVCHECGYGTPLTNSSHAGDRAFLAQLSGWGKLTKQGGAALWVWTYNTDFDNWLLPWPDYYSVGPNTRLFVQHGATGAFQEGNFMAPVGDLQEMQSWVGQKLMWDPSQDDRTLIAQFLNGWLCGDSRLQVPCDAAAAVQWHIDLISNSFLATARDSIVLSKGESYASAKNHYLTPNVILQALTNLRDAQSAPSLNRSALPMPIVRERLQRIEMGSLYVLLLRWSEISEWASEHAVSWPAESTLDRAFARFAQWYRRWGLDQRVGYDRGIDYGLSANPHTGLSWLNMTIHRTTIA